MSEFVTEPEPGGLGAVVQDLGGALWVRHGPNALGLPWYRVGNMCQRRWGQLGPVEILSDGLTKATTTRHHPRSCCGTSQERVT